MRTAQKCSGKRIEGNLAHLQTYEVSEASERRASSNASEKIPPGNLCVSRENSNKPQFQFTKNSIQTKYAECF